MKKVVLIVALIVILIVGMITLTGCTLTVKTTDNSVSASVDGETTEKVDGVIDWIKDRLSRIFKADDNNSNSSETI